MKRAALYVRVSTDEQTIENQLRELRQVAERRGWNIVATFKDEGISGAKGRAERPGLDLMLKDAGRRKFDVVMAWAIDRARALAHRPAGHDPAPGSSRGRPVPRPAGNRHDHADRKARLPGHRRLCRVRAVDDPAEGARRHHARQGTRNQNRPTVRATEDQWSRRKTGAATACEGYRYHQGRKGPGARNRYRSADQGGARRGVGWPPTRDGAGDPDLSSSELCRAWHFPLLGRLESLALSPGEYVVGRSQ
jgi:hypothetical protein